MCSPGGRGCRIVIYSIMLASGEVVALRMFQWMVVCWDYHYGIYVVVGAVKDNRKGG